MSLFASVALFRRNNNIVFKAPRKEPNASNTQARKSAARYWNGNIVDPDVLTKIVLVKRAGQLIHIAERAVNSGRDRPWVEFKLQHAEAMKQPHVAACLSELGVTAESAAPILPETLEVNGIIYRREI